VQVALRPEAFLTGNQWDRYTARGTPDAEIYSDCPFEGYSSYVSGLDLLPTLDRALGAPDLHGAQAPPEGVTKHVTATDTLSRALDGGSSTTQIVWHIDITRTGTVVCHKSGNATFCVDQKRKDQAQKDADDYEKAYKDVSQISSIDGCSKINPFAPGTPEATARSAACNQLQAAIAYNVAMRLRSLAIAADPPDPHFRTVARPAAVKLPAVTGSAPKRLRANESKALGLLDTLMTTINRATGAKAKGNAKAIRRQNAAARRYATRLAKLFTQQRRLLSAATRGLRRRLPAKERHLIPSSLARRQSAVARRMATLMRAVAHQRLKRVR
jgi:hypothetical protein